MTVSVSFKPCEGTEPTDMTLEDIDPFVMVECQIDPPCSVFERYKDYGGRVWGIKDGKPLSGGYSPGDYKVGKVIGPVTTVVINLTQPANPPARNLSELDPQVWVKCEHRSLYGPGLRCHNGKGQVYRLDKDGVPYPVDSHYVPSEYTVAGKPIGQLRIEVTDDE